MSPNSRPTFKRRMVRAFYAFRTEGSSPAKQAIALFLGVMIGANPLYGTHFIACVAVSRLFRLSLATLYAGAQVSYPVFAPFLYFAELQVGHWLRRGVFYEISLKQFGQLQLSHFVVDLALGSVVLGVALGLVLAAPFFWVLTRKQGDPDRLRLAEAAAHRYLEKGIVAWEYARLKFKRDPLYFAVLEHGLLPEKGQLLDLGCGRGLMLALLDEAEKATTQGQWIPGWAPAPSGLELTGFEMRVSRVREARNVLAERATVLRANLKTTPLPPADAVLMFDFLHYLDSSNQEKLLDRLAASLRPGGVVLIREADPHTFFWFRVTVLLKRIMGLLRGHWNPTFHFRPAQEWVSELEARGFSAEATTIPVGPGRTLIRARR